MFVKEARSAPVIKPIPALQPQKASIQMRVGMPAFQRPDAAKSSTRVISAAVAPPKLGHNVALRRPVAANSTVQRKSDDFAASHAQQRTGHHPLYVPSAPQKIPAAAWYAQGRVQSPTLQPFMPAHGQKNLTNGATGNGKRPSLPPSAMRLGGNNLRSSPLLSKIPAPIQAKPIQVIGLAARSSVTTPHAAPKGRSISGFGSLHAGPTSFNRPANTTIQRLQLHNGQLVSSFDRAKPITNSLAVITPRSGDSWHGGHASVYLEYLNEKNEGEMLRIDLFYDESYHIVVRSWRIAHEYNPSNWVTRRIFSRQIVMDEPGKLQVSGQYQAYTMSATRVQAVIAKADSIRAKGERGEIMYSFTGNKIWNMNPFSGVTYMNCADFAAELLQAAGVSGSSGVFSMPITVSAPDTRTHDQKYVEYAKMLENV